TTIRATRRPPETSLLRISILTRYSRAWCRTHSAGAIGRAPGKSLVRHKCPFPLDRVLLTVAVVFSTASRAAAQIDNDFAVGVNFTTRSAGSSMARGSNSVGLQWRIGHTDEGWGWQYAFNWFETEVHQSIGDRLTKLGRLHVRPLMGGYGYSWLVGHAAITASA